MTVKTNHIVAAIVVIILGYAVWELLIPQRYESPLLTREEAQAVSPIPLPESATNIYVAKYRHWQAYAEYVRFEAPVSVCIANAHAIVGEERVPISTEQQFSLGLTTYGFEKGLAWFDVQNISNGLVIGGGPSIPECWIDVERSIFYYRKTD